MDSWYQKIRCMGIADSQGLRRVKELKGRQRPPNLTLKVYLPLVLSMDPGEKLSLLPN